MIMEEKQLLLKDLCGRLPYGVMVENVLNHEVFDLSKYLHCLPAALENFKPYLHPMSSMTEDELRDFAKIKFENNAIWEIVEFPNMECYKGFINVRCMNKNKGDTWIFQVNTRTPLETYYGIDWLNAHHFDYRGLIEKGLALEAPEGMYKIE